MRPQCKPRPLVQPISHPSCLRRELIGTTANRPRTHPDHQHPLAAWRDLGTMSHAGFSRRQPNISFGVAILHRRNNRHVPACLISEKKQVLTDRSRLDRKRPATSDVAPLTSARSRYPNVPARCKQSASRRKRTPGIFMVSACVGCTGAPSGSSLREISPLETNGSGPRMNASEHPAVRRKRRCGG